MSGPAIIADVAAAQRDWVALVQAMQAVAEHDRLAAARGTTDGLIGLLAAVELSDLLQRLGCVWGDVIAGDETLAKICGRFGSEFAGEQEAAYLLALRHLERHNVGWQDRLSMPAALQQPARMAHPATPARPAAQAPVRRATVPTATPRRETAADRVRRTPPEGDWATTIQRILRRGPWETDAERDFLNRLAAKVAAGEALDDASTLWLRDLWWRAELRPETTPQDQ